MQKKWQVFRRRRPNLVEHLCQLRGINEDELTPNYEKHLHSPALLPDIEKACQLIVEAKRSDWSVCIFGDYDADGTPAAALLSQVLTKLGISHSVELPRREAGYGLNEDLAAAVATRYKLLITVDNGINAVEPIKMLRAADVEVIVLDHHLPKSELPPASAIVDPFLESSTYPFKHLCGCAIAYKFALALNRYFPKELPDSFTKWLLDLVAISTVADVMPIKGENRVLTHFGLIVLRHNRRLGLKHLLNKTGLDPRNIDARALGYIIGPRLNASGRLGDNRPALDLLLSRDESTALEKAAEIEAHNSKRKTELDRLQIEAEALLWRQNRKEDRFLVVIGNDWPIGLVGLVAGRLVSQFNRPVAVGSTVSGIVKASARSPETFSLKTALDAISENLISYGGHDFAVGLSFNKEALPKVVDSLKNLALRQLTPEQLIPIIKADAILQPQDLSLKTVEDVSRIGPFGFGNLEPLFVVPDCHLSMIKTVGAKGEHLKAVVQFSGRKLEAIGFGLYPRFKIDGRLSTNLLASLESDNWLGRPKLQLKIKDYVHDRALIKEVD